MAYKIKNKPKSAYPHKDRYVVLHGATGTSKEFKSPEQAEKFANKLAKTKRKSEYGISIDKMEIYPWGDFSQSHYKTIIPDKD